MGTSVPPNPLLWVIGTARRFNRKADALARLVTSESGTKLTCLDGPTMSALERGSTDTPSWLDHFWF